jgi:hypothetical protein
MGRHVIFAPMGALACLTFLALVLIPIRRFGAGRAGRVRSSDFKFGESAQVPGDVSIPNRNYMNLLELPVLFYVACFMYDLTSRVDDDVLAMAWAYVGLRAIHSIIHLTYNNVMHRVIPFALSNVLLAVFWTHFFFAGALGVW